LSTSGAGDSSTFGTRHRPLIVELNKETNKTTGPVPDELYHYTNASAALHIIESGELWASNALFLNDAEEIEHGIAIYAKVVESVKTRGTHSQRTLDLFDSSTLHAVMLRQSAVFVCCLSATRNQLSQWRAYCANGTGYSIGFRSNGFTDLRGDSPRLRLVRVLYTLEEQIGLISRLLGTFAAYLESLPEAMWNAERAILQEYFVTEFFSILSAMKLDSFGEEQEWRLVCLDWDYGEPKYSFRASRSGLIVPYYALRRPDKRLPFVRIIVGPSSHSEIAQCSTQQLLRKHGYSDVPVEFCGIPFREL